MLIKKMGWVFLELLKTIRENWQTLMTSVVEGHQDQNAKIAFVLFSLGHCLNVQVNVFFPFG